MGNPIQHNERKYRVIKLSEYFDGNVKSLGAEVDGGRFTVGVMLRGEYTFPTQSEEHLTVTVGSVEVQLPGEQWKTVNKGETVVVPPKVGVKFRVQNVVSYVCFYK